jgi:hypothetical protein
MWRHTKVRTSDSEIAHILLENRDGRPMFSLCQICFLNTAFNRETAERHTTQIRSLEHKIGQMTDVLTNASTDPAAVPAMTRQIGEAETERAKAQKALDGLREQAEAGLDGLANAVRTAVAEARNNLLAITSPQQFHDLAQELTGGLVAGRDGRVYPKETPAQETDSQAGVSKVVAGARYPPRHNTILGTLWESWKLAA